MTRAQERRLRKLSAKTGTYANPNYTCGYETIEYMPRELETNRKRTADRIRNLKKKYKDILLKMYVMELN